MSEHKIFDASEFPESESFFDKCLIDDFCNYYFAYISQIGWVRFAVAEKTNTNRYKLKEVEFLSDLYPNNKTLKHVVWGAAAYNRGLEVAASNIICIVDARS